MSAAAGCSRWSLPRMKNNTCLWEGGGFARAAHSAYTLAMAVAVAVAISVAVARAVLSALRTSGSSQMYALASAAAVPDIQ